MAKPGGRRRLWTVLGVLIAVAVVIGLLVFEPWKLFVDQRVNEALPTASSSGQPASAAPGGNATPTTPGTGGNPAPMAAPTVVATGNFVSQEHETKGTATILRLADGQRILRLTDFETSNGPDLQVWLTDQPVQTDNEGWFLFDDGQHTSLGGLKGNIGDQNYPIPADVNLADYRSVSIWCDRFSVSFGAAELNL